jgi:hypothetical protein
MFSLSAVENPTSKVCLVLDLLLGLLYIEISGDKVFPSTIEPVCCTKILSKEDEINAKEPVIFSSGDKYTLSENSESFGVSVFPCNLIVSMSEGIP